MKIRIILPLVTLLIAFFFTNCSPSPTESQTEWVSVLPLEVGNEWEYDVFSGDEPQSVKYSIIESKSFDGKNVFVFDKPWLFGKDAFFEEEGTLYGYNDSKQSPYEVIFPYNPPINYTWYQNNGQYECKILERNVAVTVQGLTYTCYKMWRGLRSDNSVHEYIWWSPGIGVVKTAYNTARIPAWGIELEEFSKD